MRALLNNIALIAKNCLQYSKSNNLVLLNVRTYCVVVKNEEATKANAESVEPKIASESVERSLHVAVIGVPNAGKSTFINNLINHRVCPTSSKVHTTRKANKAIYTTGNAQIVLYDTPGLVTEREIKKHHLEQAFKSAYRHAVQHADVIAVVHDVANSWTRNELHATVLDTIKSYPALPSFLILNKIDALKSKRILLDTIRILTNNTLSGAGRKQRQKLKKQVENAKETEADSAQQLRKREASWSHFKDVFLVSSITGNGLSDIHDYLIDFAKERPWQYPSESFTDESPESLIVESVRARLLDYLPQEIPYNLKSDIEYYSEEKNTIYASVQVLCPSARIERLICGESNGKLRQITERVTSDLVETFGKPISLTISTRSKQDKN